MSETRHDMLPLSGDLVIGRAAALYRELSPRWRTADTPAGLDLAGVGRVDSTGLALLLELKAHATRVGRPLRIEHAPDELLKLAALCEALELLELEPLPEDRA